MLADVPDATCSIVSTAEMQALQSTGNCCQNKPNSCPFLQFASTLEANILANLNVLSNVTATKVTGGSINVYNTVAFTGADANGATAGQAAYANLMKTPTGISSIYGTTYGTVTVSNVTQTTGPSPGEHLPKLNEPSCLHDSS